MRTPILSPPIYRDQSISNGHSKDQIFPSHACQGTGENHDVIVHCKSNEKCTHDAKGYPECATPAA